MITQEFVDSAGGTGEFGIIIIVDDDNSLSCEAGRDEAEAGFNGGIEVAVAESEGDSLRKVFVLEIVKPSLFDNH